MKEMTRRLTLLSVLGLVAVLGVLTAQHAFAKEEHAWLRTYDAAAVEKAMEGGSPLLLVFTKPGCPVCSRQQEALKSHLSAEKYASVQAYRVDFTKQKDVNEKYGVTAKSTLVGFQGKDEKARVIGETNSEKIKTFVETAFGK